MSVTSPARQLLQEIRDELAQLRRLEESRRLVDDGTPLSRAEVCRILHIDLKSTLAPLIRAKKVKTVPWTKGEVRIPVTELRRMQREGLPALNEAPEHKPASRVRTSVPRDRSAAAEIRSIQIK